MITIDISAWNTETQSNKIEYGSLCIYNFKFESNEKPLVTEIHSKRTSVNY